MNERNNRYNVGITGGKSSIPYTEAAGAKLPKRAKVVDLSGERIGKIRKRILKDENKNVLGRFDQDDKDNVFFYAPGENGEYTEVIGYVDKNNNLLTLENDYIATIRYRKFIFILPLLIFLGALTVFSLILAAYYLSLSKDYIPTLFITEDGGPEWREDEYIRVFENGVYNESKIHPGMEGEYRFRFENRNANRLNYDLIFTDENSFSINMGYRLRLDNVYVLGDEDTYIGIDELALKDVIIASDCSVIYTLEWKWLDGETDTAAGMNNATYTLHITFNAQTTVYIN